MDKRSSPIFREFLSGVRDELPILVGVIPFGMIYGILALGAGLSTGEAQAMSAIVFAGLAQFITVQLAGVGAPALFMILTGFVINLRHALYSASVAPYTRRLSLPWKALLAYLLTDEAYAVAITHYHRVSDDTSGKHWYFLGASLALWGSWQVSTAVGVFLGAQVPPGWSLEFTLALGHCPGHPVAERPGQLACRDSGRHYFGSGGRPAL